MDFDFEGVGGWGEERGTAGGKRVEEMARWRVRGFEVVDEGQRSWSDG